MHIASEQRLDDGVVERRFTLGEIPGMWTSASESAPAPLILVGHPGGLHKMYPRLAGRAQYYAAEYGFAAMVEEARQVTIPLQVLLHWDDEGNDRRSALYLFDAFGSKEKTLQANLGGHAGIPSFELDAGARFFARHLR